MKSRFRGWIKNPSSLGSLTIKAALSVTCVFFSIPPFSLFPLIFISLVPVWQVFASPVISWRRKVGFGCMHGVAMGIATHYWLYYAISEFGEYGAWLSVLATVLSGFITGVPFILAGLGAGCAARWYQGSVIPVLIHGSVLFGCAYIPVTLFPWTLGDSLVQWTGFAPVFAVMGQGGVLVVVFLGNSICGCVWSSIRLRSRKLTLALCRNVSILVLAIGGAAVGYRWIDEQQSAKTPHAQLQLVVVQPNTLNMMKRHAWQGVFEAVQDTVNTYTRLTDAALTESLPKAGHTRVVIWPETAYPLSFPTPVNWMSEQMNPILLRWMERYPDVHFIFGVSGYVNRQLKNYMVWVHQGVMLGYYEKRRLLAFGEYFPLRAYLPTGWVEKLWAYLDIVPGHETGVWTLPNGVRLIPNICYEVLFSDISRKARETGASLFVNLTNDGWFVVQRAQELHLLVARVRAATTAVAMVRSTNTGITAFINKYGEVERRIATNDVGHLAVEKSFPLANLHGSIWWLWVHVFSGLLLFGVWIWQTWEWREIK